MGHNRACRGSPGDDKDKIRHLWCFGVYKNAAAPVLHFGLQHEDTQAEGAANDPRFK